MPTPLTFDMLIAAVRVEINEPVEGFWKDLDIKRWLNDGNMDLTRAAKIDAAPYTFATVKNDENYDVPADFWQVRKLEREITPGVGLYTSMQHVTIDDRIESADTPGKYYVFKNQLWLVPIPNDVYNMKLFYFLDGPTLVAGTDLPIIESAYHQLIWMWACWKAKRRDDDPAFQTYQAEYEEGRLNMINDLQSRHQSEGFDIVTNDWKGIA